MTRTGLLGFAWLLIAMAALVVAQPVTYDQRQEGKVNVQVDVKDLQIVALVDSEFLGDYSYDYPLYDDADFTVKPITKRTTAKPSSTTSEPTSNANSSASPAESASSTVLESTTAKAATDEPLIKDTTLAVTNSTLALSESTPAGEQVSSAESTTSSASTAANAEGTTRRPLGTAEPRKRCPMGFQMRSGRCFKRRHSMISPKAALMKLAPALLGKSQIFGRYFTTGASS